MSADVLIHSRVPVGRITLNRPNALHALNEPMCADILSALKDWDKDPQIERVIIDHAQSTRGFCAGGDIRMLAQSGAGDGRAARAFFATEYRMNTALHNFSKPIIALIDGVTMGGGVGLSVHGSHRIATERTLFSMPETGIGLFPDVGGGWFLPRLAGEIGTWLALTGARLKGRDVVAAGIATHFVASEKLPGLVPALAEQGLQALERYAEPAGPLSFADDLPTLNACFGHQSAEEIRDALLAEPGAWAQAQAQELLSKSPRTVKVALRQLREGKRTQRFEENMIREYRIAARQVASADFLEGVRAVIIDKDNTPRWTHAGFEDVSSELIDGIFAPLPVGQDLTL